ncbi:MAG: GGDEF domain-containing protein [Coriobacteriia bacterium]|nr:GGDEF domain-containing protein [Coriobacteriia bacterium]
MDDIYQVLNEHNVICDLFDTVQLVDAQSGMLLEVRNGEVLETRISCVEALGTEERCRNCISTRALHTREHAVKLERFNGTVLLVIAVPVTIGERDVVAEMVKDITKSMTLDIQDRLHADEVSGIIEKYNQMASVDTLTGLMNRRYIDQELPAVLEGCRVRGEPVSVAMLDLDHFKNVNDKYQHLAGDLVLKGVGEVLLSFIRRNSDFAARYGGEEFMLCFPGIDAQRCRDICERIRKHIAEMTTVYEGNEIRVTISAGVASSDEFGDGFGKDEIIKLADVRLYEAKASGRNRVV